MMRPISAVKIVLGINYSEGMPDWSDKYCINWDQDEFAYMFLVLVYRAKCACFSLRYCRYIALVVWYVRV
jgi:hypothetical protein